VLLGGHEQDHSHWVEFINENGGGPGVRLKKATAEEEGVAGTSPSRSEAIRRPIEFALATKSKGPAKQIDLVARAELP